ncbi:prepilin-type cleavage/methylation N-terminal domain protein [Faecalibacterium sp. CAG:1138]|nr:prepilin-type cleavage/methylation N-terminal domain protein [Faecalibacterium sp. CAG:1138]
MMKKSNKKGFTLVELIVVIAIMAILAAVLVPTVTNKIKDANSSAAKSDCQTLANAIQADIINVQTGADTKYATSATHKNGKAEAKYEGETWTIEAEGGDDTWTCTVSKDGTVSEITKKGTGT